MEKFCGDGVFAKIIFSINLISKKKINFCFLYISIWDKSKKKNRDQLTSYEKQVLLLNSLMWRFLDIDLH